MESKRIQRVERLLQKELSEIFRRQTSKTHGVIVSVSKVHVSSDLSVCRAYLSIFPSSSAQQILDNINRNAVSVRYELAGRVRYQLRRIPEITYFIDDSLDYIEHIDSLLKQ